MRFPLTTLVAVLMFSSVMSARDKFKYYINETVFLRPGAEAQVDNDPVDLKTVPFPATIEKREGDSLWLEKAWVKTKDVMNAREAVEYYTDLTKKRPDEAILWRNLGVAWQHTNVNVQYEFALKSFTEALRLDPNDAVTYQSRAEVWRSQQKYDAAISDYAKAIELNPKDPGIYSDRGTLWMWKGEHAKAISDFTEAIKLDPGNAVYYQSRGSQLRDVGDLEGHLRDFAEIIKLCESGHADENRYGFAFSMTARIKAAWPEDKYRDGKQALALATHAYEISSRDTKPRGFEEPSVLETLAYAAAEAGDFDAAVKWAKQALKWLQKDPYNDPESPEWKDSISDLTSCIAQFKAHKPYRDPELCDRIAWAKATCRSEQYRDGKQALELATKACELTAWKKGKFLQTLAAAYAECGNFAKAIEWQEKAIELMSDDAGDPNPAGSPYNLKTIANKQLQSYQQNQPTRD